MRFFVFIAACLMSGTVFASAKDQAVMPCSEVKAPLSYTTFGFKTPAADSGWSCLANVVIKTGEQTKGYMWSKKGHGNILIAGGPIFEDSPAINKDLLNNPNENEPNKSIRKYFEAFFADQNYLKKNVTRQGMSLLYYEMPRAVLFSPLGNYMVVYYNGIPKQQQRILVFKYGDEKNHFTASCSDCSPDDFFKYVINPIIQK
jgi:hypothetical protein